MSPDLKELLALLNSHEVRYLVTGGYALAAHGSPRYTKDLDVWVDVAQSNLEKLAQALRVFGFEEAAHKVAHLSDGRRLLQLGSEPTRVDFINFASGVSFGECYTARMETRIDGVPVCVIGRDDFVRNKLASGRLTDLADLERLGVDIDPAVVAAVLKGKDS